MAFSALVVALLLVMGNAHAKMYRWVDSNGRVHYGDTLPSTYQKSGAAEMSKQGNVVNRMQSEAERKANTEHEAEQKRIQQEADKQAQQDKALTFTYTSEAEIDLARDRALEHHKLAINSAKIRAKAVEQTLSDLTAKMTRIEKSGRPPNANLTEQLNQARKENMELKRTVLTNEAAMAKVREKYAADKTRFRELKGKSPGAP